MAAPSRGQLRSRAWWNDADNPGMTALYLERFLNYGLTVDELQSERPIIGIAQTGNDLVPCNRHHLVLAERVKAGVRDAGGIPFEFPVHPLQETGKRPTAALDRDLAYLGLVEVLFGYPLDGVVLTTGCDKTTPACLMAAATVNIPAIVLSGGPMLNGWDNGRRVGSGTVIWQAGRALHAGEIDAGRYFELVAESAPSIGHCNTMGTALSMNCLAEALGMSLPGCAAIPAPYRERSQMAYETGRRAVDLVREGVTPRDIMTKEAFENAIVVASAIAASTNAPIHINAIARHVGVELASADWQRVGFHIPVLVNLLPAGEMLGEDFYQAGGVPAVMHELLAAGELHGDVKTVSGHSVADNLARHEPQDRDVIRPYAEPLLPQGGLLIVSGNIFDSAVMKTSMLSDRPIAPGVPGYEEPGVLVWRAIVFEGPEDYHERIDDPALNIDEGCVLVVRNSGPIGFPGAPEVVNMEPPAALLQRGVMFLPTLGDGRQSGTADAPSIVNASSEAAVGGNLSILQTGDRIRFDFENARVDVLLSDEEFAARRSSMPPLRLENQTPWQEIYRSSVGQLNTGGCLELAVRYQDLASAWGVPRHSH